MPALKNRWRYLLTVGDILSVGVFTVVGFASHHELASGVRMLTTFFPVCAAWGLVAPWIGLYDFKIITRTNQIWRPALVCLIAAPLAGWLRSLWLGTPVTPVFITVMAGSLTLFLTVWRIIWLVLVRKRGING